MKRRFFIVGFFIIVLAAFAVIIGTSSIQNMTLATGRVVSFNSGWSRVYSDGTVEAINAMPYYGSASKDDTVIFENIISDELCGETISFLSADKLLKIYAGDTCIYSFGYEDKRVFGHTPGSVMVFADIPEDCAGETISIVSESPYDNYAAYMTEITVGDRDVAILNFITTKMTAFLCCFAILVCGIIILIFAIIERLSKHNYVALLSMGLYVLTMFIYHAIETKMPMIFYGNQFLYSTLVFFSLMVSPLFLETYLYYWAPSHRKITMWLVALTGTNVTIQLILQFLNVKDFLEMAVFSHGVLGVLIFVTLVMGIRTVRATKKVEIFYVGTTIMGIFGALDIARNSWVKVGDFGRYSRIGVLVLAIATIISYLNDITKQQIKYAENEKAEIFSSEIINTLVAAIDAKDVYTRGHSTRVADYSMILAKALGWSDDRVKNIRYKALLHDIGKIGVPDRVLNKADRLTDDEYEIIKTHTTIGADILGGVSSLSDMGLVARNHHERFDGKGYPDKKQGYEIPAEARVVGICDAYDAMSSDRAYRKALPKNIIREELVKGRGTQFDPEMTDVFIKLFDEGQLDGIFQEPIVTKPSVDVASIINDLKKNQKDGALSVPIEEIKEIYQYICGIESRYGINHDIIILSVTWNEEVDKNALNLAMKALEYSILQSLRKTDIMTSISASQYLVVLTEANERNLHMIIDRIFTSFYSNSQNPSIHPSCEIIQD